MTRAWLTSPYGFLVVLGGGYLWLRTILAVCDVWALVRWRRSRPVPSRRTPAAKIRRHYVRTTHLPQGPHMPSEDEIRRIGRADYGPRHFEPVPIRTDAGNPGPKRTRPDRRGLVAGVVALLVVLLGGGLAGGGYLVYQKVNAATPTFVARGTLILHDSGIESNGGPCVGSGGYSDIAEGASVVVRDAKGTVVATGELSQGVYGTDSCVYPFRVSGIPENSKFYSFEVSHRGQVTMSRAEAALPQLTLGG